MVLVRVYPSPIILAFFQIFITTERTDILKRSGFTEHRVVYKVINARIKANSNPVQLSLAESGIDLGRIILGRRARMAAAMAAAVIILYLVALMPGLFFLVLPGEIALLGKGYDEARIIRLLRDGEPLIIEHWEDTEYQTEGIRIKSSDNRNISLTFAR